MAADLPAETDPRCRVALCRRLLALVCAGFAAGCTTVTIEAADGQVTVERGFGFVQVHAVPGRTPMVVRSAAVGWQAGPAGQAFGLSKTHLTLLPPDCHLLLVDGGGARWPPALLQAAADGSLCRIDDHPRHHNDHNREEAR